MLFRDEDVCSSDTGFAERIRSEIKSWLFGSALGRICVETARLAVGCLLAYIFLSWAVEILIFILKVVKIILEQGL